MEQRRLDIASLFSPLPGMSVGMNVSDMATYSHYPPHYSYQVNTSNYFRNANHLLTQSISNMQGATSLPQHDQYTAHQHMALSGDMGANQMVGSIGSTIPPMPTQQSHYASPNLGTAVSSSMHLTNSSHENDVLGATSTYKSDHDMMYYSVSSIKSSVLSVECFTSIGYAL